MYDNNEETIKIFDNFFDQYGIRNWEIGSSESKAKFVAFPISPKSENSLKIEKILSHAPKMEGWLFLDYRPRRIINDVKNIFPHIKNNTGIFLNDLKYVVYAFADGMVELDAHVPEKLLSDEVYAETSDAVWSLTEMTIGGDVLRQRVAGVFLKPLDELTQPGVSIQDLYNAMIEGSQRFNH